MRMTKSAATRTLGLTLSCALAPSVIVAAEPDGTAEREPAEVVYVYGRSLEVTLPQELARYGSDLVTVGRRTVEENAYVDPQQVLQMEVPGLYITPTGPFSYSYVSIQGSRTGRYDASDVLWLVDGVRINNRLYAGTLTDTLPGSMVERIEVLKGGESLFYGTSAAGGVINIVSRDFSDSFNGEVSVAMDTNESYTVSGMLRGRAGPGNFVAFASYDESEGYELYRPVQPSATDRKRGYDLTNVGVKYGLDATDNLRIVVQAQHTEGSLDNLRPALRAYGTNDRDEEIVSLRIDYTPSETAQLFVKGYYHDWDTRYTTINNVLGSPGARVVVDDNLYWGYEDYGVNAMGKFRLHPAVEYLVGYDFQRYSAEDEVWRIEPMTEEVHAVFVQVRTTEALQRGAIGAGVRYNDTGGTSATIWNVTGKLNLTDNLYLQGSVSTNFILPSAEQLFLNDCCEVGNPNLEPEETLNANLSLGGVTDRFYWQVTGFWREIDNIIQIDSSQPAYPDGIFMNMGEAKIEGFEVLGGISLTNALRAEASYTNAKARLEGQNRQMNYNPRAHAKASLTYDRHRYGGSIAARWVGDVHATVGSFGLVEYGNYTVADISGFFYLDFDRKHQIAARLENAFDRRYATSLRTDAADAGGSFLAMAQGVTRTFHLSYRHKF
jgi:outer membrane cobalamin receptor